MENGFVTTEEVVVSVTDVKERMHTASWMIMWSGYVLATIACGIQAWRDHKKYDPSSGADVEQGVPSNREGNETSSGDNTRSSFYRHLCLALLTRTALIPVEVYATSNYVQLVAETLPEMTFASAWTLLVSFFVQLVGAASGAGSYDRPGNILQAIAYGIYVILILTDLWNDHASVLLYAILCCIYAALLGTLLYFGPRLLAILQPSLSRRSGLGIRLIGCTLICMITFGAQSVNLARRVVAPPKERKLWWAYGSVELFPSIALLFMMHSNRSQRNKPSSGRTSTSQSEIAGRRGGDSKQGETATLIKSGASYGTSSDSS